jgi:hypothetical protein
MRVTRRDILPTTPQAVLATAPTALAVTGSRGPVPSPLAR